MFPAGQNRFDHAGQTGAGADFEKGAQAGGIHGFNFMNEFNRAGNLRRQQLAGLIRLVRIKLTGGVGIDGGPSRAEGDLRQTIPEGAAGVGHQFAVKGRGHRQLGATNPPLAQTFGCFADFVAGSGKDALFRRILVGQYQFELFFFK